ncbi:MAG TPA: DUF2007 domain-containing protein [Niabella sp.]|nr:DUF2007 domain-containing protein [Niabella sp.]HOZ97330.1 DUF2007 domain-containing protein [Niabella sp.]HQW15399.1 DUF2007 domain-containing protein [Niabella sp.]HQX20555.1 DUF2007 domain-containing protein [Niabella sp.]HQX41088.1 DUF2007 domain-containing protein [Niabella sp.]
MNYVIAEVYDNYVVAHLALGRLCEENISCWLKDENTITINPILTQAVGGIKLMVAENQLIRARQILGTDKLAYKQQHPCPKCGSVNIEVVSTPRKASNWLGTFVNLLLSAGAPLPIDKVYHCFDCGTEYEMD